MKPNERNHRSIDSYIQAGQGYIQVYSPCQHSTLTSEIHFNEFIIKLAISTD